MTLSELYNKIGRQNLVSIGLSQSVLTDAKRKKKLSASWYDAVEKLCAEKGIECPRDLFNFKAPTA